MLVDPVFSEMSVILHIANLFPLFSIASFSFSLFFKR